MREAFHEKVNILDNDKDVVVILGTQEQSSPQGLLKLIYSRDSMDLEGTPSQDNLY